MSDETGRFSRRDCTAKYSDSAVEFEPGGEVELTLVGREKVLPFRGVITKAGGA
jgi:hypothetical protein